MMTLADAILSEDPAKVREVLSYVQNINEIDEYGFPPITEAAIVDNIDIAKLLIQHGAKVNIQDMTGGTALHWAAENNNVPLCQLLLNHRANPNAFNFHGKPVLVMPLLRQQSHLKKLLLDHGADMGFAQDFINIKLLGHMFELVGTANIISPDNQYVEIDFEGFFLEVTIGIIADSLLQFKNHFGARNMRRYESLSQVIVDTMMRASELIRLQQYRVPREKHTAEIHALIQQEPLIIPVGYEGHAITFIKFGNIFVKCDRREDSRLYDNIMIYQIGQAERFTLQLAKQLIYEKQTDEYINHWLPDILNLSPITEIKIPAQISGNCSWANVEACIPTLHFLLSSRNPDFRDKISHYKIMALNYFNQWREWNRTRALNFCIQSFDHIDTLRKMCKAEILAAILFQCCNNPEMANTERVDALLKILTQARFEYLLQNYIYSYCYADVGEEGRNFLKMLREHGYQPKIK